MVSIAGGDYVREWSPPGLPVQYSLSVWRFSTSAGPAWLFFWVSYEYSTVATWSPGERSILDRDRPWMMPSTVDGTSYQPFDQTVRYEH